MYLRSYMNLIASNAFISKTSQKNRRLSSKHGIDKKPKVKEVERKIHSSVILLFLALMVKFVDHAPLVNLVK